MTLKIYRRRLREDRGNGMKQRVRIRVDVCFAPNAYACACALYICWSRELDVGCIARFILGAVDICLESRGAK